MTYDSMLDLGQERKELLARLEELRPVLAKADRIRRRLRTLEALAAEGLGGSTARRRLPPDIRAAQVLELIGSSPMTRGEIAASLGISRPHAGRIVKELLLEDQVVDRDNRIALAEGPR